MSDERRRLELLEPSKFPTVNEREVRTEILVTLLIICNGICLGCMIIGTVPILLASTLYTGMNAFYIILAGTLLDVGMGFLLAHQLGKSVQKYCEVNL